ncbi:hypothetical protein ACLOJK_013348 [Asimina triloba]
MNNPDHRSVRSHWKWASEPSRFRASPLASRLSPLAYISIPLADGSASRFSLWIDRFSWVRVWILVCPPFRPQDDLVFLAAQFLGRTSLAMDLEIVYSRVAHLFATLDISALPLVLAGARAYLTLQTAWGGARLHSPATTKENLSVKFEKTM